MQQGAKSPYEDIILFLIFVGLIVGICWGIWIYFHVPLTGFVRYVRMAELCIIRLIHGADYPLPVQGFRTFTTGQWLDFIRQLNGVTFTPDLIGLSTRAVVPALRPVFALIIFGFAAWAFFKGPNTRYRRHLDLEGLIREQAKSFPIVSPFIKFNPSKNFRVIGAAVPSELPLFAEALSPEEWIAYNEIELRGGKIDAERTYDALTSQLGTRWEGPLKLPIHAQGIYAACALRHARKRKESDDLLGEMARCWSPEKGFRPTASVKSKIRKAIKNPKLGGALLPYVNQHAYTTTALLRALQRARQEGGVLAPASFVWLRGEDRELWYPLNNLGRRSYHPEAVGALVHYTNELIAGQKIPTPRFDDVITGIQNSVTGLQGRPIPPLEKKGR